MRPFDRSCNNRLLLNIWLSVLCCVSNRSVASCLCWVVTPAMPKVAPSASQGITRDGAGESLSEFGAACWKACTNVSFLLLMTSGGMVFGVFQCWASSLTK
eukprot:COSAG02_NODE_7092_length_3189_cov_2.683172_2_plen_101_part_00